MNDERCGDIQEQSADVQALIADAAEENWTEADEVRAAQGRSER